MGRGVPDPMRFTHWLIGLCYAAWMTGAMADGIGCDKQHIVMVSASSSPIQPFGPTEVRRLFLGLAVSQHGQRIQPLLNLSNPLLYEVFLQKVIFMSASSYERRVLSRTFQHGDAQPLEFTEQARLSDALKSRPSAVTFMWEKDARDKSNFKVVYEPCENPVE